MPGRLGDGPVVVIVQFHQQAVQHLAAGLAGLPPGKAPGDPPQQVRQQRRPGLIGYCGSSDCRVLAVSHKPIMIAAAAPLPGPSDLRQHAHGHELQLSYLNAYVQASPAVHSVGPSCCLRYRYTDHDADSSFAAASRSGMKLSSSGSPSREAGPAILTVPVAGRSRPSPKMGAAIAFTPGSISSRVMA